MAGPGGDVGTIKIVSDDLGPDVPREVDALYRYVDAAGTVHFVDAEKLVPEKFKKSAKKVDLKSLEGFELAKEKLEEAKRLTDKGAKQAVEVQREVGHYVPVVKKLDLSSAGFGFLACLVLVAGFKVVIGTMKMAFKLALVVALIALLGGFYFGFINDAAGFDEPSKGPKLTSPGELIDEAKKAVDQANQQRKKEDRMLKRIEGGER
jgi:hypothetical protein